MSSFFSYNVHDDDIYFKSKTYGSGLDCLKMELSSLNISYSFLDKLSSIDKSIFNFGFIQSIYVKGETGTGIGRRHVNNFLQSLSFQDITEAYVVADLSLEQEDHIDLLRFYKSLGFQELHTKKNVFSLLKCKI